MVATRRSDKAHQEGVPGTTSDSLPTSEPSVRNSANLPYPMAAGEPAQPTASDPAVTGATGTQADRPVATHTSAAHSKPVGISAARNATPVSPSSMSKRAKSSVDAEAATAEQPVADANVDVDGAVDGSSHSSEDDSAEEHQLDAFRSIPYLTAALDSLQQQAGDGVAFLQPSQQLSHAARQTAQALYRYAVRHLLAGTAKAERAALKRGDGSGMALLPELHVDAFDAEQVWVQLDTANSAALRRVRRLVRKIGTTSTEEPAVELVKPEYVESIDVMLRAADGQSSEDDESEDEEGQEGGSDRSDEGGSSDEGDFEDALDEHLNSDEDEDEDDEEGGFLTGPRGKGAKRGRGKDQKASGKDSKKAKSSKQQQDGGDEDLLPAEDHFMRLAEMEKFLLDAEARRAAGDDDEEDEADEDMEEDDDEALFGAGSYGEEDEEMAGLLRNTARLTGRGEDGAGVGGVGTASRKQKALGGADAMYEDFFGSKGSGKAGKPDSRGGAAGRTGRGSSVADDLHGSDQQPDSDDADGEEEHADQRGGGRLKKQRLQLDEDVDEDDHAPADEDEDEDEEEGEEDDQHDDGEGEEAEGKGAEEDGRSLQLLDSRKVAKTKVKGADALAGLSTHERRLARMHERIAALEADAMGPKDWTMVGEVAGQKRPLNSALEVDLDFETSVKPPPAPTEEVMADLESLIKRRITEHRFDDVVRVVPPPTEHTKRTVELDDAKSSKGLGELYEEQYVRATVGGAAEDRDEKTRAEARALFKALVVKLDALTHFHFAPKPVVEEVSIKSDVAALAMEEAAPVGVSKAGMQTANEVFAPAAHGKPTAEGELSREDRKRRRATKKRERKGETKQKDAEKKARTIAAGGSADIVGRKSASSQVAANKAVKKAAGAGQKRSTGSDFGKSTAVFARMQEAQDQAKAGIKPPSAKAAKADKAPRDAASFKL